MGERVERMRRSRGLNQSQLAERAGTTAQQISRLERGERKLTMEWVVRLAAALECEPAELAGFAPPPDASEITRRLDEIESILLKLCHHFGVDR